MAGIVNVNGSQNVDDKKAHRKLSFDIGDKFSARVIESNSAGDEVTIKLQDGWKFTAKLDKPLEQMPEGLVKFQIEGFEDGKVQLQMMKSGNTNEADENSSLSDIVKSLSGDVDSSDNEILMKMVEHNMPLTKENIAKVKTILDFKTKIVEDDSKAQEFISTYLSNEEISPDSKEGKIVTVALKNFFQELKNIDVNEIMTFMESNIDITTDNIKSFNKLFNVDGGLYKELEKISDEALNKKNINNDEGSLKIIGEFLDNKEILPKIFAKGQDRASLVNEFISAKGIDTNIVEKEKVSLVLNNFLVEINSSEGNDTNTEIGNKNQLNGNINMASLESENINNGDSKNINIDKGIKEVLISKYLKDNGIAPISKAGNNIKEVLNIMISKLNTSNNGEVTNFLKDVMHLEIKPDEILTPKTINIKSSQNNQIDTKEIPEDFLSNFKEELVESIKNSNFGNETKSEFVEKYLNIKNVDMNKPEGKEIKLVLDSFLNKLGELTKEDVLKFINNNFKNINNKSENNITNNLANETNVVKNVLNEQVKNPATIIKMNDLQQSATVIKEQINLKINNMKDVIKAIISSQNDNVNKEFYDKIISVIQNSNNDFKVFNSISNNYYYLNVPVDFNKNQYECKLIIKDDRKNGKKIDSKNVKIAASVKTVNMGMIDAYIKVSDLNMKIDLKCEEKWVNLINMNKENIVKKISDMGYNVYVDVSKKVKELNLTDCREFFDSENHKGINITV